MIDRKIGDKPISFEVSIGKCKQAQRLAHGTGFKPVSWMNELVSYIEMIAFWQRFVPQKEMNNSLFTCVNM